MTQMIILFTVIVVSLFLFLTERWRYDLIALTALVVLVLTGVVPGQDAFSGFGHPAVITVAAVLIISRGLFYSGVVDILANWVAKLGSSVFVQVSAMTAIVAVLSGFMNNVGALAFIMPVALRVARRNNSPASFYLMPIAFGSLLGGMLTAIGTPPNIIIASIRGEAGFEPFGMFDFLPVGLGIVIAGVVFISILGWRFIPYRKEEKDLSEVFHIQDYITELRIPSGSKLSGQQLREMVFSTKTDVVVVAIIRGDESIIAPSGHEMLKEEDILIVETDHPSEMQELVDTMGFELVGSKKFGSESMSQEEMGFSEVVIMPASFLTGRTARSINLRWRYGINLLAVAREGARLRKRLGDIRFKAGDILLVQGRRENMQETLANLGCLPLAERDIRLGQRKRVALPILIFAGAIIATAFGYVSIQLAVVAVALLMVFAGIIQLRQAYESIDWSIIIFIAAMIPVGKALETTGGAGLLAQQMLKVADIFPPAITLLTLIVGTILLSNIVNNAAAAVLMAPVAINLAYGLGASVDPFLMGVAIGASCSFLTPIGHQSNILVMGPGGYKFTDYWRLGLPLTVIVVLVVIPLIMRVWPLWP